MNQDNSECIGCEIVLNSDRYKPLYKDEISSLLRKTREDLKISMKDLAKEFSMSISHLSDIELGFIERSKEEDVLINEWLKNNNAFL